MSRASAGAKSLKRSMARVLPLQRRKAPLPVGKLQFRFLENYIDRARLEPESAQTETFQRYWQMGDPLADALVAAIHANPEIQQQLDVALAQGLHAVEKPAVELTRFIEQVHAVPTWVDRRKLAAGCAAVNRVGIFGIMSLGDVALMGGYVVGAAAQTLVNTGQLDQMALRRLMETAHWWRLVTTPGGLDRYAEGFQSTVRVRMIHAHVRAALNRGDDWNRARYGEPLNQVLTVGTLMLFGQIYFASLESVGFRFSRAEREAVLHLWRYIGTIMGIDDGLLPVTEADGLRLILMLERHTLDPNDASFQLADALSATYRSFMTPPGPLQKPTGEAWLAVHSEFSRLVLGDGAADALGLPKSATAKSVLRGLSLGINVSERIRPWIPGATRLAAWSGATVRKFMLDRETRLREADLSFSPRYR